MSALTGRRDFRWFEAFKSFKAYEKTRTQALFEVIFHDKSVSL
jgi:hypothetical protein